MKIYIDQDYKCHVSPETGFREVEAPFFRNAAPAYIEGYRFVPAGESWTREDGTVFHGEMVSPWKNWSGLDGIQREYERSQNRELTAQNGELTDAMAAMVEDIYNQDMAQIQEA